MTIFRYELRQRRAYTFWWSLACGLSIYAMLPTYIGFIISGTVDMAMLESNPVFDLFGIDPAVMTQPIGVLAFLTAFFAIAAGINGMFLGLQAFTKETVGRSAEFLYVKPVVRASIYWQKLGAQLVSAVIVGACYFAGALAAALVHIPNLDLAVFALIVLSFLWVEVFFVLLGALVGAVHPKIRTPLLLSSGAVFIFYILSAFAGKVHADIIKLFTPFSYFSATPIIHGDGYLTVYIAAFLLLCAVFAITARLVFIKKDVTLVS